jgi:hypothetical protein
MSDIGWCLDTNRAIVTDGNGRAKYPTAPGGSCSDESIIMDDFNCPRPDSDSYTAEISQDIRTLCTPDSKGALSPACLQALTTLPQLCSSTGTLASALSSGYAGASAEFNDVNSYVQSRGFTIHSGIVNDGKLTWREAVGSIQGLKTEANAGNKGAANLCTGVAFDPCAIGPYEKGPFPGACITKAALEMGYNIQGTILPNNKDGINYWKNFTTASWQQILDQLKLVKETADKGPLIPGVTAQTQKNHIKAVYGVDVRWPRKGCNVQGIMIYRYICPRYDENLLPPNGVQTHFLGRYLLKDGFPQNGSQSFADQTPAGSFKQEIQRMVTVFTPKVGGKYQFYMGCDDVARLQLNSASTNMQDKGKVLLQVINNQAASGIVELVAGTPQLMTIDFLNAGGPWNFFLNTSINGSPWFQLTKDLFTLPIDRRVPMVDFSFYLLPDGFKGPTKDPQNVFQNTIINSTVGNLNGRKCMLVTGAGSAACNYAKYNQGFRARAFKSITMMVCITNRVAGINSISPALFNFFNTSSSVTTQFPRQGRPGESVDYNARRSDLSMYLMEGRMSLIYREDSRGIQAQYYPNVQPFTYNKWMHIAIVWDDDWQGYAFYIDGKNVASLRAPGPDASLIFEQFRIGSAEGQGNSYWTGGISWFRGFDYRLADDQIKTDMDDKWSDLY